MSARKKRSLVWNHFDELSGKKGRCNHCSQCISFAAGTMGNLARHLKTRHPNISLTLENGIPKPVGDERPSKKTVTAKRELLLNKKKDESYFSLLRKYCVDLVQVHNRPLEMFDDLAFQNIILLLPISMDEKLMISAKYIEELIQNEEEWLGEDIDEDDKIPPPFRVILNSEVDTHYSGILLKERRAEAAAKKRTTLKSTELYDPDSDDDEPEKLNKKDLNETDEVECTCDADEKQKKFHSPDCPAIANQKYWAFFDVSIESAECKVCYKTIKWSNMVDLKTHLIENHSELKFKDDDDVFATESSHVDPVSLATEEIYVEDMAQELNSEPKPTTRKRLKLDKQYIKSDKQYINSDKRYINSDKQYINSDKQYINQDKPYITLKDSVNVDLERFVGLDRFGLYVAYLLRALPSKKCIKFQEQIVTRLLREQAMAG